VLLKVVYLLTCRVLGLAVVVFRDIDTGQIRRKPVLGGLINEYTYAA